MSWREALLEEVSGHVVCGYHRGSVPATEPTALAVLALAAHGRSELAAKAAGWLVKCQSEDGSLGVRRGEPTPCWPTSLAVLAWLAADRSQFSSQIDSAVQWILQAQGTRLERNADVGHDTLLVAWPWVDGTHSWVEPTALHVRALKAAGLGEHARCREAVSLLLDRQLPSGGCNYGNTFILGQELLPHVQPSGIALLALADEVTSNAGVPRLQSYLHEAVTARTATASLCWALLGLTASGRRPAAADEWLEQACSRTMRRDGSPHKLALLLLAADETNRVWNVNESRTYTEAKP